MSGQTAFAEYVLGPSDYDVYSTILDKWFPVDYQKIVVIRSRTALGCSLKDINEELAFVASSMAGLRPETINDFMAKNIDTYLLENYFIYENLPSAFVSHDEIAGFFCYEDGWKKFYRRYADFKGLITFSRVGFNLYGNQALLYMASQWRDFSGAGIYVLLNRDDAGIWSIQQQVRVWNSWLPEEPNFPFSRPADQMRPVL